MEHECVYNFYTFYTYIKEVFLGFSLVVKKWNIRFFPRVVLGWAALNFLLPHYFASSQLVFFSCNEFCHTVGLS